MGKRIHTTEERDYMKRFGFHVKCLRKKYNITQAELAEKMDMTTQTLSDIENGKSDCQNTTCLLIAKAMNISLIELFTFTEEKEI